jgi:amino acid permease
MGAPELADPIRIGTGLLVDSGAALNTLSPAPLFMAYLSMMMDGHLLTYLSQSSAFRPLSPDS